MKNILILLSFFFSSIIFSQIKLDYQLHEFYDGSDYESTFKTKYQYDENNRLIVLEHLNYDNNMESYINESKATYNYDFNGNKIESLLYYWDGSQYVLEEKEVFSYNSTNDLIQKNVLDYNGAVFEPSSKIEFTYNVDHKLTQYVSYSWNGNSYFIEEESIASFDENGFLKEFINKVGSDVSPLQLYSKEEFTHNLDGKIIERIIYLWDENEEEFIPDNKKTYQLDINSNLLSSLEYEYDDEFLLLYKYEYIYDFTQLQNNFIHPFNLSNIEFSYQTDIVDFYYLQDNPFHNKILGKNILEYDEVFLPESKFIYHYNETANIYDIKNNFIKIYPNPTKNKVIISSPKKIKTYYLYDFTGKLVHQTNLSTIDLTPFDSGVYTLKILDFNSNILLKKIVKQ